MRPEELAAQLGVSQVQISKVERGKVALTLEIRLGVATKSAKSLDWIVRGGAICAQESVLERRDFSTECNVRETWRTRMETVHRLSLA